MADRLRVRTYNVRFGDAILITVPDRDPADNTVTVRNILIDVGNSLNKEGGADHVFKPVIQDIVKQLRGRPLDLYVMTHEHLDHVQGLYYAENKIYPKGWLQETLKVDTVWMTASAAADYYDRHPEAKQKKLAMDNTYAKIATHLPMRQASEAVKSILDINNPRSTKECIDYLKSLAPAGRTHYLYRGKNVTGLHPFREAHFEIWAPEEDTSQYYRQLTPMALEAVARTDEPSGSRPVLAPPSGVDAGAFYDLVEARSRGFADNLLAIDKAANNTSIVFLLEWRGRRLLFTGDAELESWRHMQDEELLRPVDFLKVSHHGSHNGTPNPEILNSVLPLSVNRNSNGRAVISTWENTYPGIPHEPTNIKLRERVSLRSNLDPNNRDRLYMDTYFIGQ